MSGLRLLFHLGLGMACAAPASAGPDPFSGMQAVEFHRLPPPAGVAQLVLPRSPAQPVRLVILLPDALGEDGRAIPYIDALTARGIATLVLGFTQEEAISASEPDLASTPAAAAAATRWAAQDGRFSPDVVALLGFGAGGRAALAAASGRPAVALYPGCSGLDLFQGGSALVVYGLAAPGAEACASLPQRPGLGFLGMPGLGHAWDMAGVAPEAGALVPDPAGTGRVRAKPDPLAATSVAEEVAARLFQALEERQLAVWMAP
jgi:dienelactone hydrolase